MMELSGIRIRTERPRRRPTATAEPLESRRLMSVALDPSIPFMNVDINVGQSNQSEGVIAVDRTHPSRLFAASNTEVGDSGLYAGRSSDGGRTWTGGNIADGTGDLEPACCDPTAAFDSFGNLYLGYVNADQDAIEIAISTDGGVTFSPLVSFKGDIDQPTLTTGDGSLWMTFTKGSKVVATGAKVTGLGTVDDFGPIQSMNGSTDGSFGDVAVGADGQVAVTYQKGRSGKSKVLVNIDPDGLGPLPFGKAIAATTTRVGLFDKVPAQPDRGIDAEAGLAYDRSNGPFRGRLYLVYTDSAPKSRINSDIFLRYSDNDGSTWSSAIRVNSDTGLAGQLLPRIAADDTTGHIAVSWHDTRDDPGGPDRSSSAITLSAATRTLRPAEDRDHDGDHGDDDDNPHDKDPTDGPVITPGPDVPSDEVTTYAAVGVPTATGMMLSEDTRLSVGGTNAGASRNGIELGDYTGLDFNAGVFHPIWADNSNATNNNPDGVGTDLDMFTTAVAETDMPALTRTALGDLTTPGGPLIVPAAASYPVLTKGKRLTYKIVYSDPDGVDPATITGIELTIAGPNGFSTTAKLVKVKPGKRRLTATVTYSLGPPDGNFSKADNGLFSVSLIDGQVKDLLGNASPGGIVGDFVVDLK